MTNVEQRGLVMAWKDYADKVKNDRKWSKTEEAEKIYQELLDRTFNKMDCNKSLSLLFWPLLYFCQRVSKVMKTFSVRQLSGSEERICCSFP